MIYNPLDKFYKSKIGAVREGSLTFRVTGDFKYCVLVLRNDFSNEYVRYQMVGNNGVFECTINTSIGLFWYYFDTCDGNFIGISEDYLGVLTQKPEPFQLSVYSKNYVVPTGLYGGVIYQIFPDRFNRSSDNKIIEEDKVFHKNLEDTPIYKPNINGKVLNNDFFGGDFKGIIKKLDYLKSLSVTHVYLNPIFKAYSNHRYDTGDYFNFDPILGSETDFKELIKESNKRGIKIILDGVFNHTGDDSIYFNKYGNYGSIGAYQSKDSEYYNWYKFVKYPNEYKSWWGIKTLPAVDKTNSKYINFITGKDGVIERYIKMGIAGWRLDVVDELPEHFVKKIRSAVKRINKDAVIIGEVWEDASNKISYGVRRKYFLGKELDSVMNYPLKDAIIDFVNSGEVKKLIYVIKEQIDHYPRKVLNNLMNILSTHDTFRLLSSVGNIDVYGKSKEELENVQLKGKDLEIAKFRLKIASLLQYTLCGVPSLYYGDEVAMQGYHDPLNRRFFPWGNEDVEILNWYKFLGILRKNYSVFSQGDFKEIYSKNGVFAFTRYDKYNEIAVIINISNNDIDLEFDGKIYNLIDKKNYHNNYTCKSNSYAIFINKT